MANEQFKEHAGICYINLMAMEYLYMYLRNIEDRQHKPLFHNLTLKNANDLYSWFDDEFFNSVWPDEA